MSVQLIDQDVESNGAAEASDRLGAPISWRGRQIARDAT
jgi:hypothetical protein